MGNTSYYCHHKRDFALRRHGKDLDGLPLVITQPQKQSQIDVKLIDLQKKINTMAQELIEEKKNHQATIK